MKDETLAYPSEDFRYPNFYCQNGKKQVRDLFIQYNQDFKSGQFFTLEDFIAIHDHF